MNNVRNSLATVGRVESTFNVVTGISVGLLLLSSGCSLVYTSIPKNGETKSPNAGNQWKVGLSSSVFAFVVIILVFVQYYFTSTSTTYAATSGFYDLVN